MLRTPRKVLASAEQLMSCKCQYLEQQQACRRWLGLLSHVSQALPDQGTSEQVASIQHRPSWACQHYPKRHCTQRQRLLPGLGAHTHSCSGHADVGVGWLQLGCSPMHCRSAVPRHGHDVCRVYYLIEVQANKLLALSAGHHGHLSTRAEDIGIHRGRLKLL